MSILKKRYGRIDLDEVARQLEAGSTRRPGGVRLHQSRRSRLGEGLRVTTRAEPHAAERGLHVVVGDTRSGAGDR